MSTVPIVSKVWSFCTTLRDDGVGYGDYLEQLTYLIFLSRWSPVSARHPSVRQGRPTMLKDWFAVLQAHHPGPD